MCARARVSRVRVRIKGCEVLMRVALWLGG